MGRRESSSDHGQQSRANATSHRRGSDCLRPFRADGIFERTKPRALPWAGILRAVGPMKMANSQLDFVSEFENQDTSRLRKKAFRSLLSLSVISPRGGELRKGSQLYRRVRKDSS